MELGKKEKTNLNDPQSNPNILQTRKQVQRQRGDMIATPSLAAEVPQAWKGEGERHGSLCWYLRELTGSLCNSLAYGTLLGEWGGGRWEMG